jgi:dihydroorotase
MQVISGRVFYRGHLEPLHIGIEEGRIVAIKKVLDGDEVEDFGDALILPGCVDMHVHFREPGLTEKEDFPHGTASAAIGGVTTVVDMPNTQPPVTTRLALQEKIAALKGRAAVDFGLFAAPRSESATAQLRNALAFKVYMAESTGGLQVEPDVLPEIVKASWEVKRLVVVHAEDGRLFQKNFPATLEGHALSRPKEAEVQAIETLSHTRTTERIHVAHVTCVEALDRVSDGMTTEVTPHHLLLDSSRPLRAFGKVNPPLRSREDRVALWDAFAKGRIDAVASDHAPHTREEKEQTFEEAPSGLPGVATSFPLLLRLAKAEKTSLERIVDAMAVRPAQVLGIEKGVIEVGRDADLISVDPRQIAKVTAKRVRYKCGWTPFEGLEGCFPSAVYLRGEKIVEDGEPIVEGMGRLISPTES